MMNMMLMRREQICREKLGGSGQSTFDRLRKLGLIGEPVPGTTLYDWDDAEARIKKVTGTEQNNQLPDVEAEFERKFLARRGK